MARSRILKPGFFSNEMLAALPYEVRLSFAGLWILADREGRLEDRPRRIGGALFPYDPLVDMNGILDQLAAALFINRYTVGSLSVIEIPTWHEHQKPHPREKPSLLPSRAPAGTSPVKVRPEQDLGVVEAKPRQPVSISTSISNSDSDSDSDSRRVVSLSPRRDPFTDQNVANRAGQFMDRYQELYVTHRKGARYAVKPVRDYAAAVTLCDTWDDDRRLDKLAIIFLTTDHHFAEEGSRTIPQFLALASWCDGKLAEHEAKKGSAA